MPAEFLKNARDKFVDAMDAGERFAIGASERAKRLKQAMFPDEIKPGNAPPMETTPKAWEHPSRAGIPAAMDTEIQRAKKSRR